MKGEKLKSTPIPEHICQLSPLPLPLPTCDMGGSYRSSCSLMATSLKSPAWKQITSFSSVFGPSLDGGREGEEDGGREGEEEEREKCQVLHTYMHVQYEH